MRVIVFVKATPSSEAGLIPDEKLMADMGKFNEELVKAGVMKMGEGLKPTSQAFRVRFSGTNRTVTDGPFPETKELVAGFWLWEVGSIEEAIAWVKKCPNPMIEDSDIEIRPLYEMADFAEWDPSGELVAQEKELTTRMAGQQAVLQPYLFFGGKCEEALQFYEKSVGAKLGMIMRFSECPDPLPEELRKPGYENKIMHSEFTLGGLKVMASDGCEMTSNFAGFSLSLTVANKADAERVFNALADGGKVTMPLMETFWSPCFGQVTDRFGIAWMVSIP